MKKTLIIIDMQNDFVYGSLANPAAEAIIPNIKKKIEKYQKNNDEIIFTRDTHNSDYLDTTEGKYLPVSHCIMGTSGWLTVDELNYPGYRHINKPTFGYKHWGYEFDTFDPEIEIVGTCTDICVISNALILKAEFPRAKIIVDASCCAGLTPEKHKAALEVMKSCQIEVINEVEDA